MGKQFGFIMSEDDLMKLIIKISEKGRIYYRDSEKHYVETTSVPNTNWIHLYFVPNNRLVNITDEKYLDVTKAYVLELRQTFIRESIKEIQRGRLYIENKYYDNDKIVYKDSELDEWYKEIVKWIKHNLPCIEIEKNGKTIKEYVSESLRSFVDKNFKIVG